MTTLQGTYNGRYEMTDVKFRNNVPTLPYPNYDSTLVLFNGARFQIPPGNYDPFQLTTQLATRINPSTCFYIWEVNRIYIEMPEPFTLTFGPELQRFCPLPSSNSTTLVPGREQMVSDYINFAPYSEAALHIGSQNFVDIKTDSVWGGEVKMQGPFVLNFNNEVNPVCTIESEGVVFECNELTCDLTPI